MNADDKRAAIAERAKKGASKIQRDAFLYLEPANDGADFAQCLDCVLWNATTRKCAALGITVEPGWSCGFFLAATHKETGQDIEPQSGLSPAKYATPKEAGLYKGEVRCENCRYGGKTCALYDRLNKELPADFDLDAKIKPHGCCNAFKPREA